jgi:hypothetical protein
MAPVPEQVRKLYRNTDTGRPMPVGMNPSAAEEAGYKQFTSADVESLDTLEIKALPVLTQVYDKVEELWPGYGAGVGARLKQGLKMGVESFTQDDPRYSSFLNSIDMFTGLLARSVSGEVGVLTEPDIQRIKKALPGPTDSPRAAKQKINDALQIVQNRIDQRGYSWIKLRKFDIPGGEGAGSSNKPDPLGIR